MTWTSPYRVACDNHNEHRPVFTAGRPLLDDSCPWCVIAAKDREIEELGTKLKLLERIAQASANKDMVSHFGPHDGSFPCAQCDLDELLGEAGIQQQDDEVRGIKYPGVDAAKGTKP